MRKFFLMTAMVLASASAHAGATRGLSLPASRAVETQKPFQQAEVSYLPTPAAEQPKTETTKAEAPKTEAPKAVETKAEPKADSPKADAKPVEKAEALKPEQKTDKPKKRRWTEQRVRRELARYGISW